jgi:hypothetical protein
MLQWVPPHERARAVSLTTSGMYLGSAAAMLALPAVAAMRGPGSLLRLNGALGLTWLGTWMLVGRDIPHRSAFRCPQSDAWPLYRASSITSSPSLFGLRALGCLLPLVCRLVGQAGNAVPPCGLTSALLPPGDSLPDPCANSSASALYACLQAGNAVRSMCMI